MALNAAESNLKDAIVNFLRVAQSERGPIKDDPTAAIEMIDTPIVHALCDACGYIDPSVAREALMEYFGG